MYDFQTVPKRLHTDSIKWDVKAGELPMWIADMDFATAPEIVAALQEKLNLAAFGYEEPHEDYFQAVAAWYETEHHTPVETAWLLYATGVIPALSSIVRRLSHVGDNVLVQAPIYNMFYNSIENNGRRVLSSDLVYADGEYTIDFTDLEAKLAQPLTTMMILCNPHNPVGKVWRKEELIEIATLCQKHQVVLVADEIHGDLVLKGPDYTPIFALPKNLRNQTIALVSPSKTFNVAALHAATVIVPDEQLRGRVNRGLNTDEVAEPNLLALPGTIVAYTQGHQWLQALRQQLQKNADLAQAFITEKLPEVKVIQGTATYLMWLDVAAVSDDATALQKFIRQETGLILSAGTVYRGNGAHFLRLNFACPESLLMDGLERLAKGLAAYKKLK